MVHPNLAFSMVEIFFNQESETFFETSRNLKPILTLNPSGLDNSSLQFTVKLIVNGKRGRCKWKGKDGVSYQKDKKTWLNKCRHFTMMELRELAGECVAHQHHVIDDRKNLSFSIDNKRSLGGCTWDVLQHLRCF